MISAFTFFQQVNQAAEPSTFNVSEYCSLYRKEFEVSYCPAETTSASGHLSLSGMSLIGVVGVLIGAVLMLGGVIIIMFDRRVARV
jgi:hypothetical protein